MIRCICLAQNVVAHRMVIVRARPGSPETPKMLIVHVLNDPLDGSFSKCRCASDGARRSGGSSSSN
eukprot:2046410-Heterocapsa_arctica.AAC.1